MQAADISIFEILRIGIGPSSSHTIGPLLAATRFRGMLKAKSPPDDCRIHVELFGSLAATGKGHRTDDAICAGLAGLNPADSPVATIWQAAVTIREKGGFPLNGKFIVFRPDLDILWKPIRGANEPLRHPNTLRFIATSGRGVLLALTAWSVGGGFVEFDDHAALAELARPASGTTVPYPFDTATDLVQLCENYNLGIAQVALANEIARGLTEAEVRDQLARRWTTMNEAIEEGLATEGILPGGLNVRRRAHRLYQQSCSKRLPLARHADLRASAYAIGVAEHNAAGGRIVTAPTNGSAGILPAVLREVSQEQNLPTSRIQEGLLIAGAIATIVKRGASISGAEVGCQGEVGTGCAMAAAAATGMLGGHARQIEDAAEIAIEHHLGLTCDPVRGLVQIPCIERNAMGAIKALNAAAMALASDGTHLVSLDRALRVMKQTGIDLKEKYRETATGGLAAG